MSLTILFIGGTGTISHACVRRALTTGHRVTVLNRGQSALRPLPPDVELVTADIRGDDVASTLAGRTFDVVCDFLSYTPDHLARGVSQWRGRTGQYVFISSASAYSKPVARLPIVESTPLVNPFWQYSRDKAACEDLLMGLIRSEGFPATIVRPSHTYDGGMTLTAGGWTDIDRMRRGAPVIVLGDGTSLWTLTHASDFAAWFVPLLGDRRAVGDVFHITGDEVLPWDAIYTELAHAAGVHSPHLVHVASATIARALPELGPDLLGDKAHSVIFDNTKVRSIATGHAQKVPFWQGAREIVAFHDAHPGLQVVDPVADRAFDALAEAALG
ncbi:MAG: NAD-dependent epimerase/dehydratase family protein [Bifidobacteriaceae bacterium]|jgi:nucleoside-diphosphate-sugar epimerase|nr:NAD-dependent epimerase/dehydratase family protein [Bifidobacteriaceae bacterium]